MRQRWLSVFLLAAACSDPAGSAQVGATDTAAQETTAGAADAADSLAKDAASETSAADGAAQADAAQPLDSLAVEDAAPGADTGPADTAPDNGLDPPDLAADAPDNGLDPPEVAADSGPIAGQDLDVLYAHTASTLYRFDKAGFTLVGQFGFDKNAGSVTDIALDEDGKLFAITFNDLFECNSKTAKCNWLAGLPQQFNGLTFVPEGVLGAKAALIGIANSGTWNHLQVNGKTATVTPLGSYGGYGSSGDAFSVKGVGTLATVTSGFFKSDELAVVDPATGKVKSIVGETGVTGLWGLAWQGGKVYAFGSDGGIYEVNPKTGKASKAAGISAPSGVSWWGAGVSTRAAGVQ